ncbi:hypothetical protein NU10_02620 [Flavobacterium dauae]|uniref:hypothetical protein n=1 Tax=Flavobacterium dauae TaxID=1563479 RepID=UPI00101B4604|nr:hypothetical protein [Flavobacterium dauae]WLD24314.1 hypothetical protein NU10_02620 [Flavobacterium dauae]
MIQATKNRKLPIVEIVPGVRFYADAVNQLLIDTENSTNTISPLEMLPLEDHYECVFDLHTRNIKKDNWRETDNRRHVYVWLHPLEVYDSEGAKIRDAREGSLLKKNLPVIDIDGVKFLFDRSKTLLLQKDNPYNRIHKSTMDIRGGEMGLYFDRQKKVVPFPHEIEALHAQGGLPSHIRFVAVSEINRKINQAEKSVKPQIPKRKGMRA